MTKQNTSAKREFWEIKEGDKVICLKGTHSGRRAIVKHVRGEYVEVLLLNEQTGHETTSLIGCGIQHVQLEK